MIRGKCDRLGSASEQYGHTTAGWLRKWMKATRRREEGTGASGTVGAKATLACHRVNMIKRHSRKAEVKMKKVGAQPSEYVS